MVKITNYCLTGLYATLIPLLTQAGNITTDGSMGAASTLSGPNYAIPQSLGTTVGNNLFHSFGTFNLNSGDVATFTGANNIQNVISRVTGGTPSSIDGTIQSQVGTANFFFLNPAGVVFGKNAQVNVPGDFHVSTANELRFSDGRTFSQTTPNGSLTAAPPEALGFLGKTGDIVIDGGQLKFANGTNVSLSGGAVTSKNGATITAPQSNLRVYGQGDTVGAVPLHGDLPKGNGAVTVNGGGWDISGDGGGNIWISGGAVSVTDNAQIYNQNTGDANSAGEINIQANTLLIDSGDIETGANAKGKSGAVAVNIDGDMQVMNGGIVASTTGAQGNAGNITVTAGSLTVDGGQAGSSLITSQTGYNAPDTTGNAGSVAITVNGQMQVLNGGVVYSSTFAKGDAGNITVTAGSLTVDGGQAGSSLITSQTGYNAPDTTGNAGSVAITVNGQMQVLNGGVVYSSTLANGNAGNVTVTAGTLTIDEQGSQYFTGIGSQADLKSTGNAGNVTIAVAGQMQVLNGGMVSSDTYAKGNAGNISITVNGQMQVLNGGVVSSDTYAEGDAGSVTVTAGTLTIDGQGSQDVTGVTSQANPNSTGNAGNVTIAVAGQMQVLNGGKVSSSTFAKGNAGSVTVTAGTLTIDGKGRENYTGIFSIAETSSDGNAGNVSITINGQMQVLNFGKVSSSTYAKGDAGSVTVNAGTLIINSKGYRTGGIFSIANSHSTGHAGHITLNVRGQMQLLNNAMVSSSTWSSGDAGAVTITAGSLILDGAVEISSSTKLSSTGKAGDVNIQVDGDMSILNGAYVSSSTISPKDAGTVTITAENLTVNNGSISTNTESTGNAGTVTINANGSIHVLNRGSISGSTSGKGDAGKVTISARSLTVDGWRSEISSQASRGSSGNGGDVIINISRSIQVLNEGVVSSSTFANGNAGSVTVTAGTLTIDGKGDTGITSDTKSSGNAGNVSIAINGQMQVLNGGLVSGSTSSEGNAGNVSITVNGQMQVLNGGSVSSRTSSEGNAGNVSITVNGQMQVLNEGVVSSSTSGKGNAGSVIVTAGTLTIDDQGYQRFSGCSSQANLYSTGNAGNVTIAVAGQMQVLNYGRISSANYGTGNSGSVTVSVGGLLFLSDGSITTTAQTGTGGPITINAPALVLDNSRITTSVLGVGSHGGDITVNGGYLVMDTGFIQANTAGHGYNGGDITINTDGVISNGGRVDIGGDTPQTFVSGSGNNVIQAAAPDGVNGYVTLSSPDLSAAAGLTGAVNQLYDLNKIHRDSCAEYRKRGGFHRKGRGGIPASPFKDFDSRRPRATAKDVDLHQQFSPATADNQVAMTCGQ